MGLLNVFGSWTARVKEGERRKTAALRREEALGVLKKLRYLRVSPPEVNNELQVLITAAQACLDWEARQETWDPRAHEALEAALEILRAFQREQDETAVETRFSQPDQNPFPHVQERVCESLRGLAKTLRDCGESLGADRPGPDTLTIHEELK